MAATSHADGDAGLSEPEVGREVSGQAEEAHFEALLECLRDSRKLDSTGYKRAGLARRIRKRLQALHIEDWDGYGRYLEVNPHLED